ncbi:MAG: hypothetical protein FWC46_03550 [Actinomycetia bacterium]|nr:hypothetical protein [Actinomycetes bacterium]
MNPGQAKFHAFVMDRVQEGKAAELETILADSFARQDAGTFDAEYMRGVVPRIMALLRPEFIEEFRQAAAHMASTM